MPYVNHRWLGGLLTNFQTINQRIRRLHDLERYEAEGQLALLPTRERMAAQADLEKLRANLGGVKNMQRVPDAMFIIDLKTEAIAVKEAQRLRIPIIGLVDTNCDPDGIEFVVPGNDDAIRSCALITEAIGQVVSEGHAVFRAEEERARKEAEEKARARRPRPAPSARPKRRRSGGRRGGAQGGGEERSAPGRSAAAAAAAAAGRRPRSAAGRRADAAARRGRRAAEQEPAAPTPADPTRPTPEAAAAPAEHGRRRGVGEAAAAEPAVAPSAAAELAAEPPAAAVQINRRDENGDTAVMSSVEISART